MRRARVQELGELLKSSGVLQEFGKDDQEFKSSRVQEFRSSACILPRSDSTTMVLARYRTPVGTSYRGTTGTSTQVPVPVGTYGPRRSQDGRNGREPFIISVPVLYYLQYLL